MAGSGDRQYDSVPVRADKLASVSRYVGILLEWRWARREQEHEFEVELVAVAADPDDAERQLELAGDICAHMFASENMLSSTLGIMEVDLDEAADPGRRPRPESAAWWRRRRCGGALRPVRFVHLRREEVARLHELLADASERARRLVAPAEDLDRECWPAPVPAAKAAAIHSTPPLLERLRSAQRLADDVLIPLRALERLMSYEPPRQHQRATPSRWER